MIVSYGTLKSKKKKSPAELRALVIEYDESVVGLEPESTEFHGRRNVRICLSLSSNFFCSCSVPTNHSLKTFTVFASEPEKKIKQIRSSEFFLSLFQGIYFLYFTISKMLVT